MAPLYRTIAEQLLTEFSGGNRATDIALPSEASLQRAFGVSRTTVRKALAELQSSGVIATRRGIGSHFVADKINKPISSRVHFRSEEKDRGAHPQTRVLGYTARPATTAEAVHFGCKSGQLVGDLCRLLLLEGRPAVHQRAVLRLPKPDDLTASQFEKVSLYEMLRRRFSLTIPRISKTLEAVEAPPSIAKHLSIEPGAAVFRIQRIGSAPDSTVVELSTNFVRGDRYYFSYSGSNEDLER